VAIFGNPMLAMLAILAMLAMRLTGFTSPEPVI
jgi:hypothetical protein